MTRQTRQTRTKALAKPPGEMSPAGRVKGGALENLLAGLGIKDDRGVQDALVVYSADDRVAEAIAKVRTGEWRSLAACFTTSGIAFAEFLQILAKVQVAQALGKAIHASLTVNTDMAEDARSRQTLCQRCDGLARVPCEEHDQGAFVDRMALVDELGPDGKPTGDQVEKPVWRRVCPACRGTGHLREPGDKESRKMILEQAGLIKHGPQVQVNLTNYGGLGLAESPASGMTLDVD